jgi:AraC-like DNA-binding protein
MVPDLHLEQGAIIVSMEITRLRADRAKVFCAGNILKHPTALDLSTWYRVSPSTISYWFSDEIGGYCGFCNRVRIMLAKKYLRRRNLELWKVAKNSGFGSLRSFNRVFKEEIGICPSEWRTMPLRGRPKKFC